MKRKSAKKQTFRTHATRKRSGARITRFIILTLGTLLLVIFGTSALSASQQIHVLGVATGPVYLADNGADGGGLDNQIPTNTPIHLDGSTNLQLPTADGQQLPTVGTTSQPSGSALVDCIGPDGRHFVTQFHTCQELNQKWGNQTFQFTPLTNSQGQNTSGQQTGQEPKETSPHNTQLPQTSLEAQTEGNKGEINLQQGGLHIEMKKEDNGQLKITAKNENGTSVDLQDNSLAKINEALQEKDIEVSSGSASTLLLRSGHTQAETQLPISLDPTTQTLAVTTSDGTKNLTVLPDQAVNELLQQNVLSHVLATATQSSASAGAALNAVTLTEQNNQPAFQVQGVSDKKLLGLFPVAFAKTVVVSAQNGQVLQVQQSLLNQLLQLISF